MVLAPFRTGSLRGILSSGIIPKTSHVRLKAHTRPSGSSIKHSFVSESCLRFGKRKLRSVGDEARTGAKVPANTFAGRDDSSKMTSDDETARSSGAEPEERVALLVIDPQRAFTCGAWARAVGGRCEPIRQAICNTQDLLHRFQVQYISHFVRSPILSILR